MGRNGGARGRQADAPSEIPARGWRDVLLRVWHRISEDRLLAIAAGVTFYALLAIVPTLAALVLVVWFGKETRGRDLRDLDPDARTFAATGM